MAIFGVQPYGSGTAAVTQDSGGRVAKNPYDGDRNGSRKIDSFTRDYVLDNTTGRIVGMTNAQQLVYLAVSTTKGSAAMRSLGQDLRSIDRITSNLVRRVDSTLRTAVQHIVDRKLIEVTGTQVQVVRPGVALARLKWRDLETGEDDETLVGQWPETIIRPTLLAISTDITDSAGGASIVLTGYRLSGATLVTVGGTSATITANTATSLTFTMPAKSAGTYDVIVTTSIGTSNPISIEAWAPTALALTGLWKASYTGAPWVADVGGVNLTSGGAPPATGSAVNGYTPADFDGVNDMLFGPNTGTHYSATAYSMAALVYVDTFTIADPGSALPYNCTSILGSETAANSSPTGGIAGTGSAGVFRFGHKSGGVWNSPSVAISTGAWTLVRVKYDGSDICVASNAGDWSRTAHGNATVTGQTTIGPNNGSTAFFDGKILHALTSNTVISDADFDKLRRYLNTRYALSL